MYLSRKGFSVYGHTDGCPGCRDIASKRKGQMAPHTVACRRRMEGAVRASDPDRWDIFLLRWRQEVASQEEPEKPADPDVEGAHADDASLFGGWEHRDLDEVVMPPSGPAPSGGLEAVQPIGLVDHIWAVDMCEVFSAPRVSKEAIKHRLEVGDAMDLTTRWDFNLESHRRQAEAYVDEQKPLVLIGSPPCVAFSQLQALFQIASAKPASWPRA